LLSHGARGDDHRNRAWYRPCRSYSDGTKVIGDGEHAKQRLRDLAANQPKLAISELVRLDYVVALAYLWALVRLRRATLIDMYMVTGPAIFLFLVSALSWPYAVFFVLAPIIVSIAMREEGR
jgi:hypothetical protein